MATRRGDTGAGSQLPADAAPRGAGRHWVTRLRPLWSPHSTPDPAPTPDFAGAAVPCAEAPNGTDSPAPRRHHCGVGGVDFHHGWAIFSQNPPRRCPLPTGLRQTWRLGHAWGWGHAWGGDWGGHKRGEGVWGAAGCECGAGRGGGCTDPPPPAPTAPSSTHSPPPPQILQHRPPPPGSRLTLAVLGAVGAVLGVNPRPLHHL